MRDEQNAESSNPENQRVIRVFISSTFRDMMQERELLVKQVFPELRRICAERFVTFTEVDLRWGITEEQAAEGKVLPICLEEIHRTRPYFIGLLGERYGWIPQNLPQEVIERESWLKEHVAGRTSVTELEVLHGVLNNPEMADHSFFFFRDPAYVNTIPEKDRKDFIVESPEAADKLNRLKHRIRSSGFPVFENYSDPNALAGAVREQFVALIDKLYPKESVPNPLDQEAMGHESYGRGKLLAYVERPEHTAALDAFAVASATGQGLALTGDSGSGKTALLASWVRRWKGAHPEDFVFVHYFGATSESASVDGFLHRILGELKRRFEIGDEIPTEPDKLREAFPIWLAQTVGRGRIILVLDALNQIEGSEPDLRLAWLQRFFPEHVRAIASALPGPALDALKERDWVERKLPLVDMEERSRMIEAFFGHYRKTLRSDLSRQLAGASGAANPLFLRTVLEELRQFGSFEQLPERVAYYLEARSPEELFGRVLRRWQEDFSNDLVRHALRHLWAARQGLSESEWLELLGTGKQALPRQTFTPLFLAIEPHLAQRSGLWAFGHDFLRQAVKAEYLSSEEECNSAHLALADYFEHQADMTSRKTAEWPWQLHAAKSWGRLETCLTDKDLFLALFKERTQWELTGYWHPLRERGILLGERYVRAFEGWLEADSTLAEDYNLPGLLGSFLRDNGCYPEAVPLFRRAIEGRERVLGKDHPDTLTSVNNLAVLLHYKGDYAAAETLYRRAIEGNERVRGKDHRETLTSVNNLAALFYNKGDYAAAEPLLRRALIGLINISRVTKQEHHNLQGCFNNLGKCLQAMGLSPEQIYVKLNEIAPEFFAAEQSASPSSDKEWQFEWLTELFESGEYAAAEEILQGLLDTGFEVLSTRLHLARIALMTDQFSVANQHVSEAWSHRNKAQPYVIARILWMQSLLALLDKADATPILGKMKTALQADDVQMGWTMKPVLDHLKLRLSADVHALLTALVAALSFKEKVADLDEFPVWRDTAPQPLE
jgi:nephrocystin-3